MSKNDETENGSTKYSDFPFPSKKILSKLSKKLIDEMTTQHLADL